MLNLLLSLVGIFALIGILARLLHRYPGDVPAAEIRSVVDEHLTPTGLETETAYFRANPGRVISRDELAERVWKQRHFYGSRAIDQAVASIRKQLRRKSEMIISVWSVGYRFESREN